MGRMGGYLTEEERLRRIGELLLKGVYLWADAVEDAAATENQTSTALDRRAVVADAPCASNEAQTALPRCDAPCPCDGAERLNGADGRRATPSAKRLLASRA